MSDTEEEDEGAIYPLHVGIGEFVCYGIETMDVQSEVEGLIGIKVDEDGAVRGIAGYFDRAGKYKQGWFRIGVDEQPVSHTGPTLKTVN